MSITGQEITASLQWQPSQAVFGQDACWFDHGGSNYYARRNAAGEVVYLSKRQRSNRRGRYYQPMNIKGAAARRLLAVLK